LQSYAPHLIERAFHQWVKKSKHMPVPSEIIEILNGLIEVERIESMAKETQRYLAELRETREKLAAEGLPYGEAQVHLILKQAVEIVKNFPVLPDPNRVYTLKERLARAREASRKPVGKVGEAQRKDASA